MVVGKRWTEDETKLALFLYFQLPFGKLHSGTAEIKQLAASLGRTPSSVAMKLSNFASLDPKIVNSGRRGLDGASKLDRQVFASFQNNWTRLVDESEQLWTSNVEHRDHAVREQAVSYRHQHLSALRPKREKLSSGWVRHSFDEPCSQTLRSNAASQGLQTLAF